MGPDVRDVAGNWMNQNNNAVNGESSGDAYSGTLPDRARRRRRRSRTARVSSRATWGAGGLEFRGQRRRHLVGDQHQQSARRHVCPAGQPAGQCGTRTQDAILKLDLSGQVGATNLEFDFWAKQIGDD